MAEPSNKKTCKKCGEEKIIDFFKKDKRCDQGVTDICLECWSNSRSKDKPAQTEEDLRPVAILEEEEIVDPCKAPFSNQAKKIEIGPKVESILDDLADMVLERIITRLRGKFL